jgi:hypothetical protein
MRNPFSHIKEVEQLELWLNDVTEELATGKTTNSFNAGDSGGGDFVWKDITPTQRQIWLVERLSQLLPGKYSTANLYPVRRTRPRFLWG